MMGNHRDAWGFGAVDPSSGTAQMLEVGMVRISGRIGYQIRSFRSTGHPVEYLIEYSAFDGYPAKHKGLF